MSQLENINFKDAENAKDNSLSLLWLVLGFFVVSFFFWIYNDGPAVYEKKLKEQENKVGVLK